MRLAKRIALQFLVLLAGCGLSQTSLSPGAAPVTTPASNNEQPLTATPFVPTLAGHHLAVLSDVAIVLDPEGPNDDGKAPQIFLVSLESHAVLATLTLPDGANPQAVVVASDNNVYVVAEGIGGVYPVDVGNRLLGAFSPVCPDPVDAATRGADLLIACRSGELVTLTATGKSTQQLDEPLARIAVDGLNNVFVATQSAEIIAIGSGSRNRPVDVVLPAFTKRSLIANTPRRLVPLPTGGVVMLYQQSLSGELTETGTDGQPDPTQPPDGAPGTSSQYSGGGGGGSMCNVPASRAAMVDVTPGGVIGMQRWIPATLALDLAMVPLVESSFAIADPASGTVTTMNGALSGTGIDDTCFPSNVPSNFNLPAGVSPPAVQIGTPTAIAYHGSSLIVLNAGAGVLELASVTSANVEEGARIALRARHPSEGFVLFHQNPAQDAPPNPAGLPFATGSNVACASCHPAGLTNGATTTLAGVTHRVMPLAGHLATATLVHWDALPFHDAVVTHTWQENMGGPPLTASQEASLRSYVGQLQMPRRATLGADDLAQGASAFNKAGCATCHIPSTGFSNGSTADIGRGLHKVPSLIGLAYTAPYMSDGCAATIQQRFDDARCGGGATHGNVASLSAGEKIALISYLQTL